MSDNTQREREKCAIQERLRQVDTVTKYILLESCAGVICFILTFAILSADGAQPYRIWILIIAIAIMGISGTLLSIRAKSMRQIERLWYL